MVPTISRNRLFVHIRPLVMSTRLLIVDDHPHARELIRGFLMMPGIVFQECASGRDAVACARDFKPHWVTMDIQMPDMNGFETTKAIKKNHPETRVMIVTSFNDPRFRDLAHSAGAAGLILKENLLTLRLLLEKETENSSELLRNPGGSAPLESPRKRVLVLDDDKEMYTTFDLLTADERYQVTQAYSGREALALHQQDPFDLIVIELFLPENEGFDTLARLRRMPSTPKFIATARSGWMPIEVYSKIARQLGVQATLAKPFQPEQLLALARTVFNF